jgi:hypothetical protein
VCVVLDTNLLVSCVIVAGLREAGIGKLHSRKPRIFAEEIRVSVSV